MNSAEYVSKETMYDYVDLAKEVMELVSMAPMKAQQMLRMGAEHFTADMKRFFTVVATVDADNLEQVFHLTNAWNQPEKVNKIADKMHSLSVGDMVFDGEHYYICDNCGWYQVEALSQSEVA